MDNVPIRPPIIFLDENSVICITLSMILIYCSYLFSLRYAPHLHAIQMDFEGKNILLYAHFFAGISEGLHCTDVDAEHNGIFAGAGAGVVNVDNSSSVVNSIGNRVGGICIDPASPMPYIAKGKATRDMWIDVK